jgi:hypothetical protein
MTALSTLVGGGGGQRPYASGGGIFPRWPETIHSTAVSLSVNTDTLVPFRPRVDVEISDIQFVRPVNTAATVYLAIYDSSGTRVSDAVSDAVTTTGMHTVSITNVTLTAETLYYIAVNQTVAVVSGDIAALAVTQLDPSFISSVRNTFEYDLINFDVFSGGSPPSDTTGAVCGVITKSRTAAAMPSSLTMTGWTAAAKLTALGLKVA